METNEETAQPEEPTTTVEVPEPDEGSESSEDKTPTDKPQSRRERREAKKFDFNAELRQRDEQLQRLRDESAARDRALAEMQGRLSERERASAKDPYEDQIGELEKAAKADLRAAAAAMEKNPQEAERLVDEHNKKLRQIARLEFRREMEAEARERSANAPQPLPPAVQHDVVRVAQEFPWLQTDAHARKAADNLVDRMIANGSPANYQTLRAAAAQIAVAFGLGGDAPPSNEQRQRYRGVGAGAAASGGGEGKRTVTMGRTEIALARALANREGKGASDEEAQRLWAEKVGTRLSNREG